MLCFVKVVFCARLLEIPFVFCNICDCVFFQRLCAPRFPLYINGFKHYYFYFINICICIVDKFRFFQTVSFPCFVKVRSPCSLSKAGASHQQIMQNGNCDFLIPPHTVPVVWHILPQYMALLKFHSSCKDRAGFHSRNKAGNMY